jgi:hypothetical protein
VLSLYTKDLITGRISALCGGDLRASLTKAAFVRTSITLQGQGDERVARGGGCLLAAQGNATTSGSGSGRDRKWGVPRIQDRLLGCRSCRGCRGSVVVNVIVAVCRTLRYRRPRRSRPGPGCRSGGGTSRSSQRRSSSHRLRRHSTPGSGRRRPAHPNTLAVLVKVFEVYSSSTDSSAQRTADAARHR